MHDDPPAVQPPSLSPDPADRAAFASSGTVRSQLPGMDRPSTDPVCPFLRTVAAGNTLGAPIDDPDPANRCVSFDDPVPQSLRQQELVCLSTAHVNCPRYLRGAVGVMPPVEKVSATRTVTPATGAALALLGLAFAVSIGFVVSSGGLILTAAVATASPAGAVLDETAEPTAEPTPDATVEPTPTPSPTPTASPSPMPSPSPTPTPSPTPEPTVRKTPKPTSDRYALLKACPGTADCYIYVVRSGDNLFSIAKYFGVPLKTVEAMNPWTRNGLVAGRDLRIPTPTR